MTYALWYTFKDDILELIIFGMYGYLLKMYAPNAFNERQSTQSTDLEMTGKQT